MTYAARWALAAVLALAGAAGVAAPATAPLRPAAALSIGETFTIDSAVLGETRRINVYLPRGAAGTALPVMVMPDGGMDEDFLHVAGLLQVGASNGTMRPFLLVGIENTERRRDLTGPTSSAKDRAIAPRVGGAAAFRRFLRTELMPQIVRRYRTTGESAIVGESLAGLFVVETLLREPDLFDSYLAIDPSLWWNDGALVRELAARTPAFAPPRALYLATSADADASGAASLAGARGLRYRQQAWPEETHATVYHPAALAGMRWLFAPRP